MKHKVSELEGALLDAAVAKAEGYVPRGTVGWNAPADYAPSRDWAHAGPIIERERISTVIGKNSNGQWEAWIGPVGYSDLNEDGNAVGSTPLIAAMRAFVASKFGDVVNLP